MSLVFENHDGLLLGEMRFPMGKYMGVAIVSTRTGGVSTSPYDSLNLGANTQDDPDSVEENRRRFLSALEITEKDIARPGQVHSTFVRQVYGGGFFPETDGLITDRPGVILSVQTADCIPLFLLDTASPSAGLIHVGWRGAQAGIIDRSLDLMRIRCNADPVKIQAVVGPCIGPCCYAVGPEVVRLFPRTVIIKNHLYLSAFVIGELTKHGLNNDNIHNMDLCTSCKRDLFFSHRRDKGVTGRMMSLLTIRKNSS